MSCATQQEYTLNKLEKNGVQIILNNRVKEIGLDYVLLNTEEKIPSYTVVWAGGVKPSHNWFKL